MSGPIFLEADHLERIAADRIRVSPHLEPWIADRLLAEAKRLRQVAEYYLAHQDEYVDDPTFITDYEYRALLESPPSPDEAKRVWSDDESERFHPVHNAARAEAAIAEMRAAGREPTADDLAAWGIEPPSEPPPPQ